MSVQPTDPTSAGEPRPGLDDVDPQEAVAESQALSEREDGTIKGGNGSADAGRASAAGGAATLEQQPISPEAERNALSEREDGTNRGS
jgi:hypothetical protein